MAIEFSSILTQAVGMTATGIPVPGDVVEKLGGAKNAAVAVRVRRSGAAMGWYEYRISIATRGGYIMSFSSANRAAWGLVAGDPLDVSIELDTQPRTIEIPDDLRAALGAAKAPETRARRIAKVVVDLRG